MNGFVMTRLDDQVLADQPSPQTTGSGGRRDVGSGFWSFCSRDMSGGTPWRTRLICGTLVLLLHLLLAVVMLHTRSQPMAQLKSEVVAVRWMAMSQPAAPQKPVESTPPAATQSPSVVEPTAQPTPPDVAPVAQAKPVDKPKPIVRPKPSAKSHPVKALTPRPRVVPAAALAPSPPPVMAAKAKSAAAEPVHEAQYQSASLRNPAPSYPPLSRRFGEEGRVVLRVLVSLAGEALTVELLTSSGHPRLDEAARRMVATWRFIPAQRGQETLQTWLRVPVVFQLRR
jgi:periplasmic protein TonB